MIVAIHQPNFLPWPGFFHKMMSSDVFIFLDEAQYVKNALFNRNRIKAKQGALFLTVPVRTKSHLDTYRDIFIDDSGGTRWVKKHLRTLFYSYKKADFFDEYFPAIEALYQKHWKKLIDLNLAFIDFVVKAMNIETDIRYESEIGSSGSRTERLVSLCRKIHATDCLSGDGSPYLEDSLFVKEGIQVRYQNFVYPIYPQVNGDFISHLSMLDMLFNCGPSAPEIILNSQKHDQIAHP